VVFPDACCKIFLTASVEAGGRRSRSSGQGVAAAWPRWRPTSAPDLAIHPGGFALCKAADAVELDSSGMPGEVVDWM